MLNQCVNVVSQTRIKRGSVHMRQETVQSRFVGLGFVLGFFCTESHKNKQLQSKKTSEGERERERMREFN